MRIQWTINNDPVWGDVLTEDAVRDMVGATVPVTDGLPRRQLGEATIVDAQIRDDQVWLTMDVEGEDALLALRSPTAGSATIDGELRELYGDPQLSIDAILEE